MTTKTKQSEPKKPPPQLAYLGGLHPATKEGFARSVAEMNVKATEGYEVVTVQRLESTIAVVYKLVKPKSRQDARLVDEEDELDSPDNGDTIFL